MFINDDGRSTKIGGSTKPVALSQSILHIVIYVTCILREFKMENFFI